MPPRPLRRAAAAAGADGELATPGRGAFLPTLDAAQLVGVDGSGTKLLLHDVGSGALTVHPIPSLPAGATATLRGTMEVVTVTS